MRGSLASLVLLAVAVSAAPSDKRDVRSTISLNKKSNMVNNGVVNMPAVKSHLSYIRKKYAQNLATYEKNMGTPHPSAKSSSTIKRQTGSDSLTDANSELWFGDITVGSTKFTVDFDTGSSDLFLPGPDCDSSCDGHTTYTTDGATKTGDTFNLAFGDGSTVNGDVFTDSVTVAGLTAESQALGAAKQYSTGFESDQFPADGLMGMAFPEIAQITATTPFFNTLIANKAVASGQFGFKLASNDAVLFLGGVDPNASSGDLKPVPVTRKGFWQVDMDSVTVGGQEALSTTSAIIDTGTTLVVGVPNQVAQVYQSIPGSQDASSTIGEGFFTFPCDSNPQVAMTFGGVSYDISSTFNLGTVEEGSSDCVGGIVGQDTGLDAWIAGDVFLANVYAQFSFDDNTVAFSKQS